MQLPNQLIQLNLLLSLFWNRARLWQNEKGSMCSAPTAVVKAIAASVALVLGGSSAMFYKTNKGKGVYLRFTGILAIGAGPLVYSRFRRVDGAIFMDRNESEGTDLTFVHVSGA